MRKIFLPVLLIMILLPSCSGVYYGGITGSVVDENGDGINDVMVAVYFDKAARDTDYNSYDKEGHADFAAPSADGIAYTNASGAYSFSKVYWKTNSAEYGKDADKTNVYLLFYNEDYGLTKSDSSVTLYSESTSQIKTAKLTSIVDTYTYEVKFNEVLSTEAGDVTSSSPITEGIKFHYEYVDYRGTLQKDTVDIVGSTFSIPVTYYCDVDTPKIPSIKLSRFESVNKELNGAESVDQYSIVKKEAIEITADSNTDKKTENIYFTKNWFIISISGQVVDSSSNNQGVDNVAVSLDLASLSNITPSTTSSKSVYTDSETPVGDGRRSGMFSGLGEDVVFFINKPEEGVATENINIKAEGKTEQVVLAINSNQSEYRVTIELN